MIQRLKSKKIVASKPAVTNLAISKTRANHRAILNQKRIQLSKHDRFRTFHRILCRMFFDYENLFKVAIFSIPDDDLPLFMTSDELPSLIKELFEEKIKLRKLEQKDSI